MGKMERNIMTQYIWISYAPVSLTNGYFLLTVITVLYIFFRKDQSKLDLKKKKRNTKKFDARLGTRIQRLEDSMNQNREHSDESNQELMMTSERIVPAKRNPQSYEKSKCQPIENIIHWIKIPDCTYWCILMSYNRWNGLYCRILRVVLCTHVGASYYWCLFRIAMGICFEFWEGCFWDYKLNFLVILCIYISNAIPVPSSVPEPFANPLSLILSPLILCVCSPTQIPNPASLP